MGIITTLNRNQTTRSFSNIQIKAKLCFCALRYPEQEEERKKVGCQLPGLSDKLFPVTVMASTDYVVSLWDFAGDTSLDQICFVENSLIKIQPQVRVCVVGIKRNIVLTLLILLGS